MQPPLDHRQIVTAGASRVERPTSGKTALLSTQRQARRLLVVLSVAGVLEVSQSRTPTGLEADAIEAAVLQGGDCVIGQVRDGAVAVTVLPVLASGKCFVGT